MPAFAGMTVAGRLHRFAASSARSHVKEQVVLGLDPRKDCGAPSGRIRLLVGSLSAPRLCGDILMPMPRRLTSASAAPRTSTVELTWPFQKTRRPRVGPLRLVRCPAGGGWGLPVCLGPLVSAGTSGAAPLIPRGRRSAARVLMDEGWGECNAAARAGDKSAVDLADDRLARHEAANAPRQREVTGPRQSSSPVPAQRTRFRPAMSTAAYGTQRVTLQFQRSETSPCLGPRQVQGHSRHKFEGRHRRERRTPDT